MTNKYRIDVTVDIAAFSLSDNDLAVLLIKRKIAPFKGERALPGGYIHDDETLIEAANRELVKESGISQAIWSSFIPLVDRIETLGGGEQLR